MTHAAARCRRQRSLGSHVLRRWIAGAESRLAMSSLPTWLSPRSCWRSQPLANMWPSCTRTCPCQPFAMVSGQSQMRSSARMDCVVLRRILWVRVRVLGSDNHNRFPNSNPNVNHNYNRNLTLPPILTETHPDPITLLTLTITVALALTLTITLTQILTLTQTVILNYNPAN